MDLSVLIGGTSLLLAIVFFLVTHFRYKREAASRPRREVKIIYNTTENIDIKSNNIVDSIRYKDNDYDHLSEVYILIQNSGNILVTSGDVLENIEIHLEGGGEIVEVDLLKQTEKSVDLQWKYDDAMLRVGFGIMKSMSAGLLRAVISNASEIGFSAKGSFVNQHVAESIVAEKWQHGNRPEEETFWYSQQEPSDGNPFPMIMAGLAALGFVGYWTVRMPSYLSSMLSPLMDVSVVAIETVMIGLATLIILGLLYLAYKVIKAGLAYSSSYDPLDQPPLKKSPYTGLPLDFSVVKAKSERRTKGSAQSGE